MIRSCRPVEIIILYISVKELDIIMSGSSKNKGRDFLSPYFLCPPRAGALLASAGRNFIIPYLYTDRQAKSEKILHKILSQNLFILSLTSIL